MVHVTASLIKDSCQPDDVKLQQSLSARQQLTSQKAAGVVANGNHAHNAAAIQPDQWDVLVVGCRIMNPCHQTPQLPGHHHPGHPHPCCHWGTACQTSPTSHDVTLQQAAANVLRPSNASKKATAL